MDKLLTVCTPTFNRRLNLVKCYESLINQTDLNFIWMIIDDGSTDKTQMEVEKWIAEGKINIKYIKKDNGGKASAINLSLEECETELWMCLDSDDFLTFDAVAIITKKYKSIESEEEICGLLALRTGPDGKVMNNQREIPSNISYSTLKHIRYELKIETEYVTVFKTNIIKQYPYPIIENEKFMPLSYVYDQIDMKYKYLIIHDDLMISEYFQDGITRQKKKLIKNNPKGYTIFNNQRIETAPNLVLKLKAVILYGVGCIIDKDSNLLNCIKQSSSKIWTIVLLPLSYFIYFSKYR